MSPRRNLLLLVAAVVVVAAVVWAVGGEQRRTVDRSLRQSEAAQAMLTAMLDQETGLRGYVQTRRAPFLGPFRRGERAFLRAAADARRSVEDLEPGVGALVRRHEREGLAWTTDARGTIAALQAGRIDAVPLRAAVRRKGQMDAVRATNARLRARLDVARRAQMRELQHLSAGLVMSIATLFAAGGWFLFGLPAERQRRRKVADARRRERQTEFARTLQVMAGEQEAHDLLRRHLERELPGARTVVLGRQDDEGRGDCLAVRLGHTHSEEGDHRLLSCERCAEAGAGRAVCTPLLVSGEVIGSVRVEHADPLSAGQRETVEDTVTQSAPVLANMRNLRRAEEQAATDALTGLPNRRAVDETLQRMIAQAHRAGGSLGVLAIDVDHFKRINDRYGHERGDEVLVAVARALADGLRASDFVGRPGGEEFLALLPDTELSGAVTAADNLRLAVAGLELRGFDAPVTVSVGVAVLPDDGADLATVVRSADRALYAAKDRGRNRVEVAVGAADAGSALRPQTAG